MPKKPNTAAPPPEPAAPTANELPAPDALEMLAGLGCTIDQAAASLGLATAEFIDLLKRDEYRAAWQRGPAAADVRVLEALFQNACAGNVEAIKFWLSNRQPDQWQPTNRRKLAPANEAPPPAPPSEAPEPAAENPPADPLEPLTGLRIRRPDELPPSKSAAS